MPITTAAVSLAVRQSSVSQCESDRENVGRDGIAEGDCIVSPEGVFPQLVGLIVTPHRGSFIFNKSFSTAATRFRAGRGANNSHLTNRLVRETALEF